VPLIEESEKLQLQTAQDTYALWWSSFRNCASAWFTGG